MNKNKSKYILVSHLAEMRKYRGLSQTELAKLSGTSQNTISSLENGVFQPSLLMAYHISRVLKMSIYDIWGLELKE